MGSNAFADSRSDAYGDAMDSSNFFVYIVESPSPEDLLDGRTEGATLSSFLHLAGIPYEYSLVVDMSQFHIALGDRFDEAFSRINLLPIIHFSGHGNEHGVQLTNQREAGDILEWSDFSSVLLRIHNNIWPFGLCMSSCGGRHAGKMARVIRKSEVPFVWVAGSSSPVSYCDAALAYSVFYRGIQMGKTKEELVLSTRSATGLVDFDIEVGEDIRTQYTNEMVQRLRKVLRK